MTEMLALRKPEPTMISASASQNTLIAGSACLAAGSVRPCMPSTAMSRWPSASSDAAEQHRLALAQPAVGEIAAEHRGDVDQAV